MTPPTMDAAGSSAMGWRRDRSDSEVAREMQAEIDGSLLMDMSNHNGGGDFNSQLDAVSGNRMRSDSDMARELQAKWDSEEFGTADVLPPAQSERADTFPSVSSPLPSASKGSSSSQATAFSPSIRSHLHRHDRFVTLCNAINVMPLMLLILLGGVSNSYITISLTQFYHLTSLDSYFQFCR